MKPAHIIASMFLIVALALMSVSAQGNNNGTIYDILSQHPEYKYFVSILDAHGFKGLLSDPSEKLTLFAPVGLKKGAQLSEEQIWYHFINGTFTLDQLAQQYLVPSNLVLESLGGRAQLLKVTQAKGVASVNGVQVSAQQEATNGVIYGIKSALSLPQDFATILNNNKQMSQLRQILKSFAKNISLDGEYETFLALDDTAFTNTQKNNPVVYNYLFLYSTNVEAQSDLLSILQYHFATTAFYSNQVTGNQTVTVNSALEGQQLTFSQDKSNLYVQSNTQDEILVRSRDILSSQGVVQVPDELLIPESFKLTSQKALNGLNATTTLDYFASVNLTQYTTGSEAYTIFVPADSAWNAAETKDYKKNDEQLKEVLLHHIIKGDITDLYNEEELTTVNNDTIIVSGDNKTIRVYLEGNEKLSAKIISSMASSNGQLYVIDRVLGVKNKPTSDDDDGGLSKTQIGWIIVGCMAGVLVVGALAVAALWYYRRRQGYEQIGQV